MRRNNKKSKTLDPGGGGPRGRRSRTRGRITKAQVVPPGGGHQIEKDLYPDTTRRGAWYDAIADRIESYRTLDGKPGIYGASRCQLCGKIGRFSGFVGALATHFGPDHSYVCGACVKRIGRHAVTARLTASRTRWCEVCGCTVIRSEAHRRERLWVCKACRARARREHRQFRAWVGGLTRKRFLYMTYPTVRELLAFERDVLAIKADVEAIAAEWARSRRKAPA